MHIKIFKSAILALLILVETSQAQLPENPNDWVCSTESAAEIQQKADAWCKEHLPNDKELDWRKRIGFTMMPGEMTDLNKKNAFDGALRKFLRAQVYTQLSGWGFDQNWRMTGPYVGEFGSGQSYGVHPAVRVYYSPEMVDWMCGNRKGEIPIGAMIIKEMANINEDLGIVKPDNCMHIPDDDKRIPSSWTVMFRTDVTHDQWYWANPTNTPKKADPVNGDGNPPILDKSAFTWENNVPNYSVTPIK